MRVKLYPRTARGSVTVPPSKSIAHRMLICAALADGRSRIIGTEDSEDILATCDCLAALGADVSVFRKVAYINGTGGRVSTDLPVLDCRESGSTLRFLLPISLLGGGAVLRGSRRLLERGVDVYRDMLSPRGISFVGTDDGITVSGRLSAGDYALPGNVSSQFISGMLLALPLLEGGRDSTLHIIPPFESREYVDMTLDVMKSFGVTVFRDGELDFSIKGGERYAARKAAEVEGDWSQAAFFSLFQAMGCDVEILGLNDESLQGDRCCVEMLKAIKHGGAEIDISDCPDLGPVLFAAAAVFGRGARFVGTRRLSLKECDRAAAMAEELAHFGVSSEVSENSVLIRPGRLHAPDAPLCGHNDHRVVMALSVLCSVTGGEINDAEAVNKSYPGFFDDLRSIGVTNRRVI